MTKTKEFLKRNALTIIVTCLWFILWVIIYPIINHHIEVTKIKNQIEEVQLQIELNKEQWNTCLENMDTWHAENEQNRQILNDLMLQYNDMVGFTTAWQK